MPRNKRILVHQIGSLGDTIVSMPGLRMIRRFYGESAEITLLSDLAPAEIVKPADVLEGSGLIDRFIEYRLGSSRAEQVKAIGSLWMRLTRNRFDAVVYLMQSEKSEKAVKRDATFFALCGIRTRLGFEAFSRSDLYPRDAKGLPMPVTHEGARRATRLAKFGFGAVQDGDLNDPFLKAPEGHRLKAEGWLKQNRRFPERYLVAICPGTKMPAKTWPTERFVEIGRRLLDTGKFEIVVAGGPADKALAAELIEAWGSGLNAAGEFSVMGSAALLHQCRFVVSVDSGPMHLAAVGGVPCVALFSSVDFPGRFSPLGRNHILLRHGELPCAACRRTVCNVEGHPCMTGITVDAAWQAVIQVSNKAGVPIEV